ncbi:MAG TPA: ATP-dependent helicase [Burkholderiaceae bacterium]|nr:ATP-dependent helicase [Burkholderiaceae bacterium]
MNRYLAPESPRPQALASQVQDALDSSPVPKYLQSLNAAQRQAVLCGTTNEDPAAPSEPLLVIAGAGSGKTNTLAHRVAHLVASGADPGRIMLVTFTTRAADEMCRRVARILAQLAQGKARCRAASIAWSGTFHSIGARLLREYAPRVGLAPGFTIHDREDSADLMNLVRHELGYSAKAKRFPLKGTCLAIYSSIVNTAGTLHETLRSTYPWCAEWEEDLKRLFLSYVEAKQAQCVLDYDDLLLYWARMVEQPPLGREIGDRFSHVLVDEYQDTNRLQAAILLAMKPDGCGLTVVGDDAQSIYAFRGATVRNILDFPQQFAPAAHLVTLDRNYRSTAPILAAANAVIALAKERFTKDLWTERSASAKPRLVCVRDDADQAQFVVEESLARRERGIKLRAQAVLFRAAHHSARLELELARHNIPFVKFGGLKFLEAAHVKDVLALLRWAQNPRDRVSGFRALQLLDGLGPKGAARILDQIAGAAPGHESLPEKALPPLAQAAWQEFVMLIGSLGRANAAWPAAFEQGCRWYEAQMQRLFDDAHIRAADIQQLARIASTYASQERFLTELTLEPPQATSDEAGVPLLDEDYLILSTIHSSKGREWTAVTLLNAVDGCIPSDLATGDAAQIEEERRLLYVAMTRARDDLDIIVPQRFHVGAQSAVGDRHVYAIRSRFLTPATLMHFELIAWPPPSAIDTRSTVAAQGDALDLTAQMRAMWR